MKCRAEHAEVTGDRQKMKEVILNLISNALKHTESRGVITLESREQGMAAEIVVRDTGEGISPENLVHIFERFYRIPGTGIHGTGLGLNICREIIELHGGTISVESTVGTGSIFTIRLPIAPKLDAVTSGIL
jgi:signal transduction histidine kinase